MSFLKRCFLFTIFLLVVLSIYHDLDEGPEGTENNYAKAPVAAIEFEIAHIKVLSGDTVLSITEELNPSSNINVEQILYDFKKINPNTDPYHLKTNHIYYFPLYNDS